MLAKFLSGAKGGIASGPDMGLAYLGAQQSTANTNLYTFYNFNLGTENSSRKILVCVTFYRLLAISISSITVAGVTASQLVYRNARALNPASNTSGVAIYVASVPTGTTGNVVVTMNGVSGTCGVSLYRINRTSPTPTASGGDVASPYSLSFSGLTGNDAIICCSGVFPYTAGAATVTWTGVTEDLDVLVETNNLYHSSASLKNVSFPSLDVTVTPSAAYDTGLVGVHYSAQA